MASRLSRIGYFHPKIPLWKQKIPEYPVFWEGNPQNRVLLCHFWMKMVKPKTDCPKHHVHFEVHPQMSKFDIKQYIEKLYKVPVCKVQIKVFEGKPLYHKTKGYLMAREDDTKMAYVTLDEGHTFEFPELADMYKSLKKQDKEFTDYDNALKRVEQRDWDRLSLPPWFRR